jgi:hypothetical protein
LKDGVPYIYLHAGRFQPSRVMKMPPLKIVDEIKIRLGVVPRSLRDINALPANMKEAIYVGLVPRDLFESYGIDAKIFMNEKGEKSLEFVYPPGEGILKLSLKRSVEDIDPIVYIQLRDTIYSQVEFEWIIINDPDSERFNINRNPGTQFLPPSSWFRNIPEEIRAMQAGLAPGQVRRGLHKFEGIIALLEELLSSIGVGLIIGFPYAYHNAIELERIGFFYVSGRDMMERIHRGFQPGGKLFSRLDGSGPFRQPGMEKTIRGRSWTIHDGILAEPWICPQMQKIVGRKARDLTFPDAFYLEKEIDNVKEIW